MSATITTSQKERPCMKTRLLSIIFQYNRIFVSFIFQIFCKTSIVLLDVVVKESLRKVIYYQFFGNILFEYAPIIKEAMIGTKII